VLTDDLLELQRLDTLADRLAHRRRTTPERAAAAAARAALDEHRKRRAERARRAEELAVTIDALERDGEELGTQRTRLEAQLKTVTSPRQAEALTHELETLAERRDALDDQELEALEEQSAVAEELAALDAATPGLEEDAAAADTALSVVEAEIDGELASVRAARDELAARIDPGMLARYTTLRERHGGVAVAKLEGSRCTGCHLDLSTTELAEVRAVGEGEFAECPNCGRMLVP
jgi:predicted  nucleic acid-binding Zn-ribbon protein